MLSDEKKKKLYDQFGEAGLGAAGAGGSGGSSEGSGGMPFRASPFGGGGGGGTHQTFSFSTGGGGRGGGFQGSDPFSIFESMFGTGDINEGALRAGRLRFVCVALCQVCSASTNVPLSIG